MRLKLEIGKHERGFAYIDITLTSKVSENIDNDKVYDFILDNFNYNLDDEFTACDSSEEVYKNEVQYINSICFDYNRGEMADKYKDIKTFFKDVKSRILKMQNGKVFKK